MFKRDRVRRVRLVLVECVLAKKRTRKTYFFQDTQLWFEGSSTPQIRPSLRALRGYNPCTGSAYVRFFFRLQCEYCSLQIMQSISCIPASARSSTFIADGYAARSLCLEQFGIESV